MHQLKERDDSQLEVVETWSATKSREKKATVPKDTFIRHTRFGRCHSRGCWSNTWSHQQRWNGFERFAEIWFRFLQEHLMVRLSLNQLSLSCTHRKRLVFYQTSWFESHEQTSCSRLLGEALQHGILLLILSERNATLSLKSNKNNQFLFYFLFTIHTWLKGHSAK